MDITKTTEPKSDQRARNGIRERGDAHLMKKLEHSSNSWESWSETVDADSSSYIVHHSGPDDIYPARSWREAVEISYDINTSVLEYVRRTENDGWVMSWATPYRRDIAAQAGLIRNG